MFKDTLSVSIGPNTFNVGKNWDDWLLLRFFFFTAMKEPLFETGVQEAWLRMILEAVEKTNCTLARDRTLTVQLIKCCSVWTTPN
jgi:hypothetical protein